MNPISEGTASSQRILKDVAELKRLAEAATPGPWKASFTKFSDVTAENGALIAKCARLDSLTRLEANARYIAAANPAVILELLAQRDELLAALERTMSWLASYPGGGPLRPDGPYEQARSAIARVTP